ncbi:hypothetical protein, partial [Vibrio vulnificus]|uniref:hypothetical protein n=1 Tax=Vibrio vulnificus TaxID=672 RepID=UPI0039B5D614
IQRDVIGETCTHSGRLLILGAAMTVHERGARQIFVAAGEHHWLRGICSLYGIGRFRLADLKCVYVFVYLYTKHLSAQAKF